MLFLKLILLLVVGTQAASKGPAKASSKASSKASAKGQQKTTVNENASSAASSTLVDPMRHDIFLINRRNYDSLTLTSKTRMPSAVLFCSSDLPECADFVEKKWQPLAAELKGMVKIGAIDCLSEADFCQQQISKAAHLAKDAAGNQPQPQKMPLVAVYPPPPIPAFVMDESELVDTKKTASILTRFISSDKVQKLQNLEELEKFFSGHVSLPKVLLFSEKDKIPVLYSAITNSFNDRLVFGFISKNAEGSDAMVKKLHLKKWPTLLVKKGDSSLSAKGIEIYKGQTMKFVEIHDFINVHSETFVKGGGFLSDSEAAKIPTISKPWLLERIPEMNKASNQEICFRKKSGFCVVYLLKGDSGGNSETDSSSSASSSPAVLDNETKDMLEKISNKGDNFMVSWLNIDNEEAIAKQLNINNEGRKFPSAIVFNPHKRLRYLLLDSSKTASEENLESLLEMIMNGDGRFTVVKGNKLAPFASKASLLKKEEL